MSAFVAQRIEHLITDQKVGGSSPSERTSIPPGHSTWGSLEEEGYLPPCAIGCAISPVERTETRTQTFAFKVTFAKLPPDVLAVGKPTAGGLEIVLDQGRSDCTDGIATSWRDRALAAVGKHLVEMLVVADELGGEGHEIEAFVVSERQAYVQSTLEDLSQCLGVVGEPGL